jgi:hypothetical protein
MRGGAIKARRHPRRGGFPIGVDRCGGEDGTDTRDPCVSGG